MAYASRPDVEALMAQMSVSSSTKPNTMQFDSITAMVSAEIDVALSSKGVVTIPVVNPVYFVEWLKLVNAEGAAARILKSMFPATTGAGENPAWAFWQKLYLEAIKGIEDGSVLPDEIISGASSHIKPSSFFTSYPDGNDEVIGTAAESFFRRDKIF